MWFYVAKSGFMSANLDVRNSLSIAKSLATSDRYELFLVFFKMAAVGDFGCPKITFDRISGHFRSIGHIGFPKFTFDRNSGHFRLIRNFNFFRRPFWTKWPPDRPFWMSENNFRSQFLPFQIDTQLFFFDFFDKMAAGGHFGLDDNVSYRTRPRYLDE